MLLRIAPELARQPLYLVDADLVRDLACNSSDCILGWADCGTIMDRNCADRLGDNYHGPGRLIVLDCAAISQAAARPDSFAACLRNTAIHEAGHVVPFHEVLEPADSVFVRNWQAARLKADFASRPPTDADHGWRFIRRTTHLFFRALAAGFDIAWQDLFGPQPWVTQSPHYLVALLNECVSMRDATFAEIESVQPPKAFLNLWQDNQTFFNKYFA
jgi:hypothetical protein